MDLIAARDLISLSGSSYHEMEEASESEAHRSARQEAIGYFLCHGYSVYPEGVGVAGIMTLADFFAVRDRRPLIDGFQCAASDWPDEYFYGVFKLRAVDLRDEIEWQFHSIGIRVVEETPDLVDGG